MADQRTIDLYEWLERQTIIGNIEWRGDRWALASSDMLPAQHELWRSRLDAANRAGIRPRAVIDALRLARQRNARR